MMTASRRVLVAALLVAATPLPAAAQFWEVVRWLNDMSGPQMHGTVYEASALCLYEENARRVFPFCAPYVLDPYSKREVRRIWSFGVRVGRLANFKELANEREVRDINMFVYGPAVRWSPPRMKAVDLAAAYERSRWFGDSVPDSFTVDSVHGAFVVRPITLVRPDSRRGEFLGLALSYQKFFDTFDGARFAAPGTFVSENEVIVRAVVHIDVYTLIRPRG